MNTLRLTVCIVNLTESVFRGLYHGKRKHDGELIRGQTFAIVVQSYPDDMQAMLERSRAAGVRSMIITGGSLHESKEALELASQLAFYATIGCHPTRSKEFEEFPAGPAGYLEELDKLIAAHLTGKGRVVAVGECGLGTSGATYTWLKVSL